MEDNQTSPVDNPNAASGEVENIVNKDVVAYETHKKLLGEKKRMQAELEEAKKTNQSYQLAKDTADGKKDEVIKHWQERANKAEADLKETRENEYWTSLNVSVERVASKHGCIIPSDFIKLIGDDIDAISVNGSAVDDSSIEYIVEKHKKANPRLFHSKEVRFSDGTPQQQFVQTNKPVTEMTGAELETHYKKLSGV